MILFIDNYDSFSYNLVQYFKELNQQVAVFKNDEKDLARLKALNPSHLVISPGPGTPQDAGISLDLIKHFLGKKPILGICLGHQCLAYCLGAKIKQAAEIKHGKTSKVTHHSSSLFNNIPTPFIAARYHSLVIDEDSLPEELNITARCKSDIMAIEHVTHRAFGVQFHPEALLTEYGHQLLNNFIMRSV